MISRTRIAFCLPLAVIAAALADPIVEFGSNAGLFGHGSFTDRSNLDIVPALGVGVTFLAVFMVRKARAVLAGRALPRDVTGVLPLIFALQICTLYAIETLEQLAVFGHVAGPMTWLGGPLPISLGIHALVCLAVSYAVARSRRQIAATTLRIVRLVTAICRLAVRTAPPVIARRFEIVCHARQLLARCAVGERAPPIVVANII